MDTKVVVSEIQDSWETIIEKIKNGTADYVVGQYKPLDLGCQGIVRMQIVAAGEKASDLSDGKGNATYDLISMETLRMEHHMNDWHSMENSWETSSMRAYLNEMVSLLIPEEFRDSIKKVMKVSASREDFVYTEDRLWIPSYDEIFRGVYGDIYKDAKSRRKVFAGTSSPSNWWLRSACSDYSDIFRYVSSSGIANYLGAGSSYGVALGFSL